MAATTATTAGSSTSTSTPRRALIGVLLAVVALLATACSEDTDPTSVVAEEPSESTDDTSTTTEAASTTSTDATSTTTDDGLVIEPISGPTRSYVTSAMGGVRFNAPDDLVVRVAGDQVVVTIEESNAEDFYSEAFVGLTSQLASSVPVSTVDAYIEAVREAGVEPTPMDTTIDVLGYELTGYRMDADSDVVALFANERIGRPMESWYGPGTGSRIEFLGETPSGVLVAGVTDSERDAAELLPVLGRVLDSIELTGPGLDPALPPGDPMDLGDPSSPPPPAESSASAPPPLGEPFNPLESGRYELLNFGIPLSIDTPDGWFVQPNFPGVVILTAAGSIGPGDRDLVWINDIRELVPIAGGPIVAGDPILADELVAMLESARADSPFDSVERFELTSGDGTVMPVIRFDVESDDTAACTAIDPCDFALVTSYGFVKTLTSMVEQRIWLFPEHPTGVAAAVAQSPIGIDWLEDADAVMESMELR